jgi:hypothetical protein
MSWTSSIDEINNALFAFVKGRYHKGTNWCATNWTVKRLFRYLRFQRRVALMADAMTTNVLVALVDGEKEQFHGITTEDWTVTRKTSQF